MQPYIIKNPTLEMVVEILSKHINKQISVWCGKPIVNSFDNQISICGPLEKYPSIEEYRIFINNGTYVYFNAENIVSYSYYDDNKLFNDGSGLEVRIKIV